MWPFRGTFCTKNDANKVSKSLQTSDSLGLLRSSVSSKSLQRKKDIDTNYEDKKGNRSNFGKRKKLEMVQIRRQMGVGTSCERR